MGKYISSGVGRILSRIGKSIAMKMGLFAALACALMPDSHAAGPVKNAAQARITVAAAANVRFAMEALKKEFKRETGIGVETVYGSSGKLAERIRAGAPFDVFLSADMGFPDSLYASGFATEKPRTYVYGKLVLWTMKDLDLKQGMAVLSDSGVHVIAIADPVRAPYGREALEILKRLGLEEALKPKLVTGENIAEVGEYILSGKADIGFDAKSLVLESGKGRWREVDSALYDPIAQGAVITKYGAETHPGQSSKFYAFIFSTPARVIFNRSGYTLP
jgi:molybdate transport system substrate-binding protein